MPGLPAPRKTLWEEGRHPGHVVVRLAALAVVALVLLSMVVGNHLGLVFDIGFVMVCIASALAVRPRNLFTVGVMPPLLLAGVVVTLAVVDRGAVARPQDAVVQAVVSGLAHQAVTLVVGYALTLGVIGLRQLALRHDGALRPLSTPR